MRIALVTRRYPPLIGGAEKVLSYLAEAFAAGGAEVTVLTSRIDPALSASEQPRPNLTIRRLPTSRLRFVGTWLYMRHLKRWFVRNQVDVAYVSMLKHDAFVVVEEGRRRRFPVVLRPEGAGATGDMAWQKWGRFGTQIARRTRKADAIVAISAAVRSELEASGYDHGRIIDLPNGVPLPSTTWKPSTTPRRVAVFVGRLAVEKGIDTLIDAWAIVVSQHPEARLLLVGDGPLRPKLEAQVCALGLGESVHFAGASTEPQAHLASADLFVLPSREEGMSISLLEAMAFGIPIIATDIPGNRRLIDDGEHGRLVPPDDPKRLAEALLRAWNEADQSHLMANQARRRVQEEYSIDAVAQRHLELFERLELAHSLAKGIARGMPI